MPFFYEYTGDDQDLVVESAEPRPDLLEWASWKQVDAPAKAAASPRSTSQLDGHAVTAPGDEARIKVLEPEPEPKPEPQPKPAAKKAAPRNPRTAKAAPKATESE